MSNACIYIIVEGQTEQTFVREVLAPHLAIKGQYLFPSLIGKPGHKGGAITLARAYDDIVIFLKQRSDTFITTMFDFYRIDSDWPGRETIRNRTQQGTSLTVLEKADILETATKEYIRKALPDHDVERRFMPYIQMHEFETLLFSDAAALARGINVSQSQIDDILNQFSSPEEIDDGPTTAPSKRLERLTRYTKIVKGTSITSDIGIANIEAKCPHFKQWIETLEHLAN